MTDGIGGFKPPDHMDRFASWIIMLIAAAVFVIYTLIRRHFRKRGPILCNAHRSAGRLLADADALWQHKVGPVVFHCTHKAPQRRWFSPPRGTQFIAEFLKTQFGTAPGGAANLQIPDDVDPQLLFAVSVPAKNFRCGGAITEFVARDAKIGFWSYQMVCGGVQMTLFHVEEDTFVAGVTIFAANRWAIVGERLEWAFAADRMIYQPRAVVDKTIERRWCRVRLQWIVVTRNQYGEIDKFGFNGDANRLEPVECFECCAQPPALYAPGTTPSHPLPDCLNWLKVEFCAVQKRPVMIGRNAAGAIVHFDWNTAIAKFQLKECASCVYAGKHQFETTQGAHGAAEGDADDKPPSYEYLELIEMVEQ